MLIIAQSNMPTPGPWASVTTPAAGWWPTSSTTASPRWSDGSSRGWVLNYKGCPLLRLSSCRGGSKRGMPAKRSMR